MFICQLLEDPLHTLMHWPYQRLAAPLGTPDDVIHNLVSTMLLMLVLQVARIAFFNGARKSEGPFIPWLKPRGFLAQLCNL